jgi:signal transduction histidine kinase
MNMDVMHTPPTSEQAELLALAVHEFRTPVTVIAGYLRMLVREQLGPLSDRQKKVLEEAERSCGRLTALVGEMSELSTLDAGPARPGHDALALAATMDDIAAAAAEGRDRGVTISRSGLEDVHAVVGDRRRVTAALGSLVTAILREQNDAGRVVIDIGRREADGRLMAAITIAPDHLANEPWDNGGPDARLNEFRGGLGLALPIARRVIEQAGGRVWSPATGRTLGAVAVLLPLKETSW